MISRRPSSSEKLAAIAVGFLAVISPLYIDRKQYFEPEDEDESGSFVAPLMQPVVLVLLVAGAIGLTCLLDRGLMRFDLYWIHRVGGSSCGLVAILLVLGVVLKCKASFGS